LAILIASAPNLTISDEREWRRFRSSLPARKSVYVDLSLGSWRPRHAAAELARQIGADLSPRYSGPEQGPRDEPVDDALKAELIGRGIDEETSGRSAPRLAHADANEIRDLLEQADIECVVVLATRFGPRICEEDIHFLRFLGRSRGLAVVTVGIDQRPAASSMWGLYPGLIPPELAGLVPGGYLEVLPDGSAMFDPFLRPDPASAPKGMFGELAARCGSDGWVRAYCAVYGHNLFADTAFLLIVGTAAQFAGSDEIAQRLFDRAYTCGKTVLDKTLALARAQGLRIATGRFTEAAAAPRPNSSAPAELANYVEQMSAWAQVMTGKAEQAAAIFEPLAQTITRKAEPTVYELYLLNIAALGRLRRGDIEGAEQAEIFIAARRAAGANDCRLAYVNQLNLSRLSRRRHAFAEARDRQRKAFAAGRGQTTGWEAFHLAILEGLMAEALNEDAQSHWLHAALLWLCEPVPESIPDRIVWALLDRQASGAADLHEEISSRLAKRLKPRGAERRGPRPRFGRVGFRATVDAVITSPIGCICIANKGEEAISSGPAYENLAAVLETALWREELRSEVKGQLLLIDLSRGLGLETGQEAAFGMALRHQARTMVFDDRRHVLDDELRESIWSLASVALHPAVVEVGTRERESFARFCRHAAPTRLNESAMRVVNAVIGGLSLKDMEGDVAQVREQVLALEEARVLTLSWDKERCTAAGIR
jgi:hypothetical protein